MTAPRSIELDQHVLAGVIDDIVEVLAYDNLYKTQQHVQNSLFATFKFKSIASRKLIIMENYCHIRTVHQVVVVLHANQDYVPIYHHTHSSEITINNLGKRTVKYTLNLKLIESFNTRAYLNVAIIAGWDGLRLDVRLQLATQEVVDKLLQILRAKQHTRYVVIIKICNTSSIH